MTAMRVRNCEWEGMGHEAATGLKGRVGMQVCSISEVLLHLSSIKAGARL